MRKITKQACSAFENSRINQPDKNEIIVNFKKDNTKVITVNPSTGWARTEMYLHGNMIAFRYERSMSKLTSSIIEPSLFISNCGYFTNTTKERLNGLTGVKIHQKDFVWYLNDKEWNGDWIKV